MQELRRNYSKFGGIIKERLSEFKANWLNDARVFEELIFCLLTPQSRAVSCNRAVKELFNQGIENWDREQLEEILSRKTRFYKQKALNIMNAKKLFFCNGNLAIRDILKEHWIEEDKFKTREWLVENVRGMGLKEASHFLRNIGFYENIAIIDRHILKNMKRYGVISEIPKTITKKKYYELEQKLREFSKGIGIPMEELDLLFWASETGFVFK